MTNSTELLKDVIRKGKAFSGRGGQPNKAKKHRYERRKVRCFIRVSDWYEDDDI